MVVEKISGKIISAWVIGAASLASAAFLWERGLALFALLSVLAAIMLLSGKSRRELKTFAACALFGAGAESFAIFFGAWKYSNPDFLGIPLWLVPLWGIAAIFITRTYDFFK